ncbi:e1-E2 family cation-transporting ATPase [Clostridium sp. CAG:451]|nr:e1-E2 family cation-transporting ATPase [Clostridium sp. CAG:451]
MSKRYNPDKNIGLSKEQVNERIKDNLVNFNTNVKTKSAKEIILENTVTLFNIINVILAVAIILVGSYKNLGFLLIIVLNTVISTFQELHSKSVIDKLSVVSASKVKVLRDKEEYDVNLDEVVLDDIIILELGNQVITDAIIVDGVVEVDESFITGESDTLIKKEGDMLLSGSFIVSGNAKAKVEHIGYDNYTAKISSDTKYIKPISSEIMRSLNKIVKTISVIIVPLGILLFARQLYLSGNTLQNAVVNTVAAIIGMIPEGLVLLTSTVFAVSVIRLSKEKVLVQDLYCIESLARVDVICLDKTGTITEGKMEVVDVIPLDGETKALLGDILGSMMAATKDKNATAIAIRDAYYRKPKWKVEEVIPFSSEKKYSGVKFATDTYLIGAVEFVLKDHGKSYQKMLDDYIKKYRVLVLVKVNNYGKKNEERKALGFILLQDKVRKEAKKTLEYFKEQGVAIKIISGDNPITVSAIAKRAGLTEKLRVIDLSTLNSEEEIQKAALEYDVFGRVKPEEKHLLIRALKEAGHNVAMTGDGVNDCLALKEADCSIAMASGSDAARSVSQLVLLDSNFASMPSVVAEGRRSINNLERSASLFLVKTIYAGILAFLFLFIEMSYPFIPIQLTLASVVTIGIPSFVLALEPNKERVKGKFLVNVLKKSAPPAFTIILNILLICLAGQMFSLSYAKISTLCLTLTGYTSFILLFKICRPFNRIRLILFSTMFYLFIYAIFNLTTLFSITHFNVFMIFLAFILMYLSHRLYTFFEMLIDKLMMKLSSKNRI